MLFKVENGCLYWFFSDIIKGDNKGIFHTDVEKKEV